MGGLETFNGRLKIGEIFENEIEAYFLDKKVISAKNGTEHTHPDFVNSLRNNKTDGAKMIRFEPDGIASIKNDVICWEAKCGKHLERDAYETYMKYNSIGKRIIMFLKIGEEVKWQYVDKISFIDSYEIVNKFPDNPHPVKDGWIYPRLGNNIGGGSGTPYREVDILSLENNIVWNTWK